MLRLGQRGGDSMKKALSEIFDTDQISGLWSEAYKDWVADWEETANKQGSALMACCGGEPSENPILWPIERE
jgi:hypothetical protein